MVRFKDAINSSGLYEVKFIGPMFTWLYQTREGIQIRECLDKALISREWSALFPDVVVIHKSSTSDHNQILLFFRPKPKRKKPRSLFRFESMCLKDPKCEQIVIEAWLEGADLDPSFLILSCMDSCRTKLTACNQTDFGHVGKKIS